MDARLRDLRHASAEQLALRAAVLAGTAVFVVLAALTGGHPLYDPWFALLPMGLGLLSALMPHGPLPLILLGWLVVVWALGGSGAAGPALLPAAASLLVVHTACALAGALPARAPVPAALLGRTLRRMAVVLAVVVLLWGALRLLAPAAPGSGLWGTVSLMAGAAVVGGAVTVYDRWVQRAGRAGGGRSFPTAEGTC